MLGNCWERRSRSGRPGQGVEGDRRGTAENVDPVGRRGVSDRAAVMVGEASFTEITE